VSSAHSAAGATRTYSSAWGGRLVALLAGVFGVPLLAVGLPKLLLELMLDIDDSTVLIAVCVAILVIGGAWLLVHVFVTGPIRFETDARSVRLRKGPRVTNEWQRDSAIFASLVERQSTNGVPTGSVRKVFATTSAERTEIVCRWFTASTFNDLMADLSPVGALTGDSAASADAPRSFALDPRAGRPTGARRATSIVLLSVAIVGLLVGWVYLLSEAQNDPGFLVFTAIFVSVLLLVVLIAFGVRRRRAAKIPKSITVTGATVQIDGTALYFAQLASIELTPPGYSGNMRRMVLVEKTGTRTGYPLGGAATQGSAVFTDYDGFVALLGRVAPAGLVRFDLR
jgi:hypothetical protein